MAKKIITTTEFTDDIDGGAAAATVTFSFDGVDYEIDLSKKNKTAMSKVLKPYVDSARKVKATRTRTRPGSGAAGARRSDLAAIREWAKANGLDVSDRGRIAASVTEAYDNAH